jgi:hypothetical protein
MSKPWVLDTGLLDGVPEEHRAKTDPLAGYNLCRRHGVQGTSTDLLICAVSSRGMTQHYALATQGKQPGCRISGGEKLRLGKQFQFQKGGSGDAAQERCRSVRVGGEQTKAASRQGTDPEWMDITCIVVAREAQVLKN